MMAKSQLAKLKNAVQNGENADNVLNEFDHVGSRPPDGHRYLVP